MKEVLKLVNLVIKKSYDVSFSKLLGMKDLKIISTNKTTAAFSYKIDESLCVLSPETPRLSTAATLAVFDELSTMGKRNLQNFNDVRNEPKLCSNDCRRCFRSFPAHP